MEVGGSGSCLTDGERDSLRLVHANLPLDEIAARLGLSLSGVKYRLKSARDKLGATGSAQAARMVFGDTVRDSPSRTVPAKSVSEPSSPDDPYPIAGVREVIAVEERLAAYDTSPIRSWPEPSIPPSVGGTHNDLNWLWKLLLGLLCGFVALASVGAAVAIGGLLR